MAVLILVTDNSINENENNNTSGGAYYVQYINILKLISQKLFLTSF